MEVKKKMEEETTSKKTYLSRNLKFYKWSVTGEPGKLPDLVLYNKKSGVVFPIPKVYAMSLHKFIPNYLDKIRILQTKRLRKQLAKAKENNRTKVKQLRLRIKKRTNSQKVHAQGHITKEKE